MTPAELKAAYRSGTLAKPAYIELMQAAHQALYGYAEFIKGTGIGRIEIADGRIVVVTREPEIRLLVDPADPRLAAADLLNFDAYEEAETGMLSRLIRRGDTVLDVGANVGWHAIFLAKRVPGITVHSFEPVPDTYHSLVEHLELNGMAEIHPHHFGFSKEAGRLSFFLPPASVNASAANLTGRPDVRRIDVEVRRLDDFVRAEGITPAVVKVDVEGAELHVLEGAPDTLRRHRPVVFAEMLRKWAAPFGYHPNEIIRLMASHGYRCFVIRGEGLEEFLAMDDATVDTNFFFLHGERHAEALASVIRRR